ncbi:MAG: DNA repair protein RadA [Candidatus Cardinium sp.]|nr:DNA repair protein RadA [Candidatus Cardinium sp.]
MTFVCANCGVSYAKWQGKCDTCQTWNLLTPFTESAKSSVLSGLANNALSLPNNQPIKIDDVAAVPLARLCTQDIELNRVLGGGIVPGSLVLLGGEPGIGKSTLLLQMALQLESCKVLYASGEETVAQIKIRAERLALAAQNCFLLQENSLRKLLEHVDALQPAVLIIDSMQTLYGEEAGGIGSMHQIRACATRLLYYAKQTGRAIFLIGHINKEGTLAGPKLLEHIVDTVLQFEGDKHFLYRMVRTIKNRFGAASELGMYEMTASGLQTVPNPSAVLLATQDCSVSGTAIGSCLEGSRVFFIEVQSLVSISKYGNPQRNATGYDPRRLTMLLAVLEKRAGLRLQDRDVFVNITGGLKVDDPALDLAVCMAIVGSLKDNAIVHDQCFIGEVGLSGTLRKVLRVEQRIAEAERLGFKEVFIAAQNQSITRSFRVNINYVQTLKELITYLIH